MSRKEIGSFLELELRKNMEYYRGKNIARLNSGRAAIFHAIRILGCREIYIPFYECPLVSEFLEQNKITVNYYALNSQFQPMISEKLSENTAILIVNYFGIFSKNNMEQIIRLYKNVIIDNAQAFFSQPISCCINIYSARKFIGVPDGSYVVGKGVNNYIEEYEQDYSSDTGLFLLQRIEYGCSKKVYESRIQNEERINQSGIKQMSKLTHAILDSVDYRNIIKKRKSNFSICCELFQEMNRLDCTRWYDDTCVPMVYPLVMEQESLQDELLKQHILQGRWWKYLLEKIPSDSLECYMSKYMIPITVDQRYQEKDFKYIKSIIIGGYSSQ